MSRLVNATIVNDPNIFDAIQGEAKEVVFEYRIETPFTISKEHTPDHEGYDKDENDVVVYGPVYVGDEKMLDRHKELVEPKAIMESWESYSKNPVILYNHRKDYGVIGMMEHVEMGHYEKPDGEKIQAVFGRARIDSGEEAIVRKIRKGMLKAFSIGFIAKAAIKEGRGDEAYLKFVKIEWIETSVVDIPASPNALFNISKSLVEYDGQKQIIAVEERDGSYVIEFEKSSDTPNEPAPPSESVEMDFQKGDCDCGTKARVGTDKYTTEAEARRRAGQLGCTGTHSMTEDGRTIYMPCSTHADYTAATSGGGGSGGGGGGGGYSDSKTLDEEEVMDLLDTIAGLEAKLAELESRIQEPIGGDTVKTHDENHDVMTDAQIAEETIDEVDETIELSAPVEEETFVVKDDHDHEETDEVEEATEEVEEEVTEEEAVEDEVVEEALDDEEVVEEVAEATEEESNDEPVETKDEEVSEVAVLSEVVVGLTGVESKVAELIARLDESESLKALLAEKDAEIASLNETIEANAKQAEFDAAVDAKVAERLAEQGVEVASATPKSLSPVPTDVLTKDSTSHDPQPQVSKGMAHLGAWLEGRLGGRRLE